MDLLASIEAGLTIDPTHRLASSACAIMRLCRCTTAARGIQRGRNQSAIVLGSVAPSLLTQPAAGANTVGLSR